MFYDMVDFLEEKDGDRFKIEIMQISEKDAEISRLRSMISGNREYLNLRSGSYIRLIDKTTNEIVMSDTQMERDTNRIFCKRANGDVLIAGLGIGMILMAIQDKEEVKSITIIEKHDEIINLVGEQLPLNEKVTLINEDIFNWIPPKNKKYDTVYFDIWNNICGDDWEEHKKLRRKYARRVNRNNAQHWINSWRREDYKRLATSY